MAGDLSGKGRTSNRAGSYTMSGLVSVQTLRGTAGLEEAQKVVSTAVAKFNEGSKEQHEVVFFTAVDPNTKGMQFRLSLWAQLARANGCNLIRLSVHNGNVALVGPADDVARVQEEFTPVYNALVTKATQVYVAAEHGPRMGFMNAYECGLCAAMSVPTPALSYGIGTLFQFPKPGNGSAYDLGAAGLDLPTPKASAPRTVRKTKAVA